MEYLILIAIILIVAFFVVSKKIKEVEGGGGDKGDYQLQKKLFSVAERSFLGVLELAVEGRYRVFGKVRVADVLAPRKGLAKKDWRLAFNRITAKHYDYLLCDPETLEVKAAVELDDKSHDNKKRMERDEFLEKASASAGLPLIRIKAQRTYSTQEVRDAIDAALNPAARELVAAAAQ